MTTILEVIERISFLAAMPAVIGLIAAMAMLLVSRRWQVHVLGMAVLYFFATLLYTRVIRPEVAVIKLLIGSMITLTLYMTGRHISVQQEQLRQIQEEEREEEEEEDEKEEEEEEAVSTASRFSLAPGVPLRALVLVSVLIVAVAGSHRFPLPQIPGDVGLACYLLVLSGILLMGLSENPFRAGLGLLTFLVGFDLFYGPLEPSLVVTGLLGAANFLVTLAVTFLAVTYAAHWEGRA
jgi:hypothetical protein